MHKILSLNERSSLLESHKREKIKGNADRIKSVLLYDEGWTFFQIAKALFISDDTAARYVLEYEEKQKLKADHQGKAPLLNLEHSRLLSEHLHAVTYTKIKDIQAYVKAEWAIDIAVSSLHGWLKKNGFSYKKPKLIPKADPVLQDAFVKKYEAIMNEAAITGDPVLFGDSVHPSQQTRASYGWIKTGQDKVISITAARKRLNIMGALNLETMGFDYQEFETINGRSAVEFLRTVERRYPDAKTIHLIWDQAGYHTAKEVKDYLSSKPCRIKVHYLPPRSPNLNSIERLWKIMHEYVSNNRVYGKFRDFRESIFEFFDKTMKNIHDVLISRITDHFHITDRKLI